MKTITCTIDHFGRATLKFGFDRELIELVKAVSGFAFDKTSKAWWGPVHAVAALEFAGRTRGVQLAVTWPMQAPAMLIQSARELRPYQQEGAAKLISSPSYILAWAMRSGKGLKPGTKVLTPYGWKAVEMLHSGDDVIDPDTGATARVDGVFSRAALPCYRVTMSDGASVVVDHEHLWTVETPTGKYRGRRQRTFSTVELLQRGLRTKGHSAKEKRGRGNRRWFIPLTAPVQFAPQGEPLPIDPWLLGALLADGCFRQAHAVQISKTDPDFLARVKASSGLELRGKANKPADWTFIGAGALREKLVALHLFGLGSLEKFIPEMYRYAAPEARLELLRGLMDGDGDISRREGKVVTLATTFNTSSPRLRDDVLALIESLGGFGSVNEKVAPKFSYRGEVRTGAPAWRIHVRMPVNPFSVPAKASKWEPRTIARGIESIEYAGEHPTVCIKVNSKRGLFVTERYIVTHNTSVGIEAGASMIATRQIGRVLVLAPAMTLVGWEHQIREMFPGLPFAEMSGRANVLIGQPRAKTEKDLRELRAQALALSGAGFVLCQHDLMAHRAKDLLWLADQGLFAVGCDEPQSFADFKAPRSVALMDLAQHQNAFRRWGFSGTLMRNRSADLPVMFEFLGCPPPRGATKKRGPWSYLIRYAGAAEVSHNAETGASHWEASDVETEPEELKAKLWSIGHKLTREEIAPWLPKAERQVILTKLTGQTAAGYKALEASLGKLALEAVNGSERVDALKTLSGYVLAPKIQAVIERLRLHGEEGASKVVCGMMFHESLEKLIEGLRAKPLSCPVFVAAGWMSPEKRQSEIAGWQQTQGGAVLLCNILANSVGLDLADAAIQVNGELPWVPSDALQWEARLQDVHHGKRSTAPLYEYVLAKGTIDEDMALAMLTKMGAIDRILGGEREQHGLDAALRASGLVSTVDLGLSDRSEVGVEAALDGLRRRLMGETGGAALVGAALSAEALAGAMSEAFDDEPSEESYE